VWAWCAVCVSEWGGVGIVCTVCVYLCCVCCVCVTCFSTKPSSRSLKSTTFCSWNILNSAITLSVTTSKSTFATFAAAWERQSSSWNEFKVHLKCGCKCKYKWKNKCKGKCKTKCKCKCRCKCDDRCRLGRYLRHTDGEGKNVTFRCKAIPTLSSILVCFIIQFMHLSSASSDDTHCVHHTDSPTVREYIYWLWCDREINIIDCNIINCLISYLVAVRLYSNRHRNETIWDY
jgi:hypothetical protein